MLPVLEPVLRVGDGGGVPAELEPGRRVSLNLEQVRGRARSWKNIIFFKNLISNNVSQMVERGRLSPLGQYLPDNVALVVNLNGPLSSYCCVMREFSIADIRLANRLQF